MKYNNVIQNEKYLGRSGTKLFLKLLEEGQQTFTLDQAQAATSLQRQSVLNFLHDLQRQGLVSRIENGLYNLVPLEMGKDAKEYLGNPLVVAKQLLQKKLKTQEPEYYISHASAMDIHQMLTQPQFAVFVSTTKQIHGKNILGTDFKFVTIKKDNYFGFKNFWITPNETALVSDLEKTVIDGLRAPQYCGGIVEVAKGFWMRRTTINLETLVSYAERLDVGSICGRLGLLLESYNMLSPDQEKRLLRKVGSAYSLFDPTSLSEGNYLAKWRLRINVTQDELRATART